MTTGACRAWLPALASAATAIGMVVILAVAVGVVGGTREDATESVARMAAALWELPNGGDEAVQRFLDDRAEIEAVPQGGEPPSAPGAYAYGPGSLRPAIRITVPPPPRAAPLPPTPTALALLGLLLVSAWAIARRGSPPPHRYPAATLLTATALLGLVAVTAHRWTRHQLEDLSEHRVAHAVRAVETAIATGADTERAARVAALPWATSAALTGPEAPWTMPRAVGTAIATHTAITTPDPATPYTIEANGAIYHAAHIPTPPPTTTAAQPPPPGLHLALLGYQETHSPAVRLAATATAAALLTALILFLLPLSARPPALRRTVTAWAFLAPAALLLAVFTFGPLLFSLWISLHEWHLVDPVHPFTGLDNYHNLILDVDWWAALRNTAVFTLHVPLAMAVALALALLTRGSRRAVRWARLALFLPGITSVVAIAVVWKWLLNDGYGPVNRLLEFAGLGPVAWLTSPDTALVTLMAISVWMVVGYQMVVFQAGLAAIPRDWYDAARVDGAGTLQRFRHITLPGLRHTLFFVLVTSVIGSFPDLRARLRHDRGRPARRHRRGRVPHLPRGVGVLRFGNAAAMSWILFAVVFAATWLHFRILEGRAAHA